MILLNIFQMTSDVKHLFNDVELTVHLYIFENMSIQILCPFEIWLFIYFGSPEEFFGILESRSLCDFYDCFFPSCVLPFYFFDSNPSTPCPFKN